MIDSAILWDVKKHRGTMILSDLDWLGEVAEPFGKESKPQVIKAGESFGGAAKPQVRKGACWANR